MFVGWWRALGTKKFFTPKRRCPSFSPEVQNFKQLPTLAIKIVLMKGSIPLLSFWILLGFYSFGRAQDPNRFSQEVDQYIEEEFARDENRPLILFTGSSSIRFWKDLEDTYPGKQIVNRGFGGSQMSDLLHFAEELILSYRPEQIFIYEGDNDVSFGKSAKVIMRDAKKLVRKIRKSLPEAEIVFISAKPSIARWSLQKQYIKVNDKLEKYASRKPGIRYADVWTKMLDQNGQVLQDIFIQDNLHMNAKGYTIWRAAIEPFLLR